MMEHEFTIERSDDGFYVRRDGKPFGWADTLAHAARLIDDVLTEETEKQKIATLHGIKMPKDKEWVKMTDEKGNGKTITVAMTLDVTRIYHRAPDKLEEALRDECYAESLAQAVRLALDADHVAVNNFKVFVQEEP